MRAGGQAGLDSEPPRAPPQAPKLQDRADMEELLLVQWRVTRNLHDEL